MAFLLLTDYLELIDLTNLNQVTSNELSRVSVMELTAIGELKSYLVQRYNCDKAFADINTFKLANVYNLQDRIIWTETDWSDVVNYVIGDLVNASDGNIYQAIANSLDSDPTTNPLDWGVALAKNNTLYYNIFPYPSYNDDTVYYIGNRIVFVDNKVYEATKTIPQGVQPIDSSSTVNTAWKFIENAATTTGELPTNTTYWKKGDNRDQQLVQKCIDITLYHLHARINPRNIPEIRMNRYAEAKTWLEMIAGGKINCALPERYELGTTTGVAISYGFSQDLINKKSYC